MAHRRARPNGRAVRLVVVTPAYNAARHLGGVVDRLLRASPPGLARIVVVDDGSRDDTLAVARGLAAERPEVAVVRRARNGGYGAAMKDGLAAAIAASADVVAAGRWKKSTYTASGVCRC